MENGSSNKKGVQNDHFERLTYHLTADGATMTSALYSTIGSLCQGVFDMQAIENDALKPGPIYGPVLVHLWSTFKKHLKPA